MEKSDLTETIKMLLVTAKDLYKVADALHIAEKLKDQSPKAFEATSEAALVLLDKIQSIAIDLKKSI